MTIATAARITVRALKRRDGLCAAGVSGALVLMSGVSVDKLAPSEPGGRIGQFSLARNFVIRR